MSARDDVRRAAQALTDRGEALFSPIELITQARENGCAYPDVTLRTHIVNYMCINAGGPSAGRYPDLIRVSRGLYRLANNSQSAPSVRRASTVVASIRTPRETRARHNVDALIDDFDNSLSTFESVEVFSGPSLYFHVRALERRRQASSAAVLLKDERFLEYVYAVLPSWGMHRMGNQAAKVPDFEEFTRSLQACRSEIEMLWALDITAIEDATVRQVGHQLWSIIGRLRASTSASRLVSGSKTLHHVLPDLMPPIDRSRDKDFTHLPGIFKNHVVGGQNAGAGRVDDLVVLRGFVLEALRLARALALGLVGRIRVLGQALDRNPRILAILVVAGLGRVFVALHQHTIQGDAVLHQIRDRHRRWPLGFAARAQQQGGTKPSTGNESFGGIWHVVLTINVTQTPISRHVAPVTRLTT